MVAFILTLITNLWPPKLSQKSPGPKVAPILPKVLKGAIVPWKFLDEGFYWMLKGSSDIGFGSVGGLISQEIENVKEVYQGFNNRFKNTYLASAAGTKKGRDRGRGGEGEKSDSSLPFSLPLPLSLPIRCLPRSLIHTLSENMGAKMDPWSYRATLDNSDSNTLLSCKTTQHFSSWCANEWSHE